MQDVCFNLILTQAFIHLIKKNIITKNVTLMIGTINGKLKIVDLLVSLILNKKILGLKRLYFHGPETSLINTTLTDSESTRFLKFQNGFGVNLQLEQKSIQLERF